MPFKSSQDNWFIELKAPGGGFAPAWWKRGDGYITVGNANQFSKMTSIDFTDSNCLFKQGPGITKLSNSAQVSTLIKGITPIAASANVAFAAGGNKLYKFSLTAIRNSSGVWPKTIDNTGYTGEDAESVLVYQNDVYAFYNHSGGGDIGKLTVATNSFDEDWGTTVPVGATLIQNAPHPSWLAADKMLFGNGRYVGSYDGTTLDDGTGSAGLDFKSGSEVAAGVYTDGWNWIGVNYPSITGNNSNEAIIYIWDGESSSWETTIKFRGRIGAMLEDNGIIYIWYQEENNDGGYKFGYILGNSIKEIETYDNGMPLYYQVAKDGGFLKWAADQQIYAWGTIAKNKISPVIFDNMDGGLATVGGIGNPFGTLFAASYDGASAYQFNKASGLETASNIYSLLFDVTNGRFESIIDEIIFDIYPMASGARCDFKIIPDMDLTRSASIGTLSNTIDGATLTRKRFYPKIMAQNFQIKGDYTNGSATNSVEVRKITIFGHFLRKNG